MQVEHKINIHNRFDVEVNGKWVAYAENIVLDQMWDRLCAGSGYFANIHFGTGTGTPAANRTTLFTHLGTKTAIDEEKVKALPVSRWKRKITLNPEEFVGATITEVGVAFGATNSNLVTHALLKDSEGNVISITKSDTDVIIIYATIFVTFNNTSGLVTMGMPQNNQLVNYLIDGVSFPSGTFVLASIFNAAQNLGNSASASWTSDRLNKKRKTNVLRFGINDAIGHIKYLIYNNLFSLELPAPGIFTGQSYSGVSMGSGDGIKTKWTLPSANIKDTNLVIKKNGVIISAYTKNLRFTEFDKINNPSVLPIYNGRGVALTPDGLVMAVAHENSPCITTYDWVGGAWMKRPNPTVLPKGNGQGVALTPDGSVMVVAHGSAPFVTTYDWVGGAWIKRPDPSVLPTNISNGVALTPDGSVMAVASESSPYITSYDWVGGAWVKRPNPAALPSDTGRAVSLTPDGLVMAVAHNGSPSVATYDWIGGAWIKRSNPAALPSGDGLGVALSGDGLVMVMAHSNSPFVTTYDWVGGAWVKRPNPSVLPTGAGFGVTLTPDGLVMAVAHSGSPYISTYDWVGGAWVKRPNPAVLPTTTSGTGVALTPEGSRMVVAHNSSPYITTYKALPFTEITFDTPPVIGDVITADYTVDGVHKTDQYVIDVSCAIQFGEG